MSNAEMWVMLVALLAADFVVFMAWVLHAGVQRPPATVDGLHGAIRVLLALFALGLCHRYGFNFALCTVTFP